MLTVLLLVLGLILGSFVNAMVGRMHAGRGWVKGRSQCDTCGHQLSALDLAPVLSWLALRGKCRYCHSKISWQHPAVEVTAGLVFALSYVFWPLSLSVPGNRLLFATWLISAVGLLALAIYDLRWMLLPNKLIFPTLLVAAAGRLAYILAYGSNKPHLFLLWLLALLVSSGIFWLLFMVSRGRWIGYGDVRLGLITGTLLAAPGLSFLMIFAASLAGTAVAIPLIVVGKKSFSSRLPYGPFLIAATGFILLFGQSILDWYNGLFPG